MKNILILFLLFSSLSFGQAAITTAPKTTWQLFTYDAGNIFKGIGYAYSRPLHWQRRQWVNFGSIAAGTGMLYLIDDTSTKFFTDQKKHIPKFLLDYGWHVGSPEKNYMITGAVYFTGLFTKNEKLRRTGVLLVSSASAAGLFQQIFKSATGRARPTSGLQKKPFSTF